MKTKCKPLLIGVLILLNYNVVLAQEREFSKNSIKTGFGVGMSAGCNTDGVGFVYTIGYQREIWKDRLRFNPNFSIGHYNSKFILDARDQYFNSINIEANLYYDVIKAKSFSIVLGCGGLVNNTKGLKGAGGYPEDSQEPVTSEYVNNFHIGAYVGGGFRINPPNKRTAITIMPVNLHIGTNTFAEFHPKIELDFKL